MPGFGHPVHRPLDPRAERILELADERGVSGAARRARPRALRGAVAEVWGKPLTMNVSLPIAAVMLDLGFPASVVKAVPILARTASLLAHLAEEQRAPARLPAGGAAEEAVESSASMMLEPEVETRPWEEQLALDDAAYREQLAYLLERSPFYREKLGAASSTPSGGLDRDRAAPAHREAGAARHRHAENPFGAHLARRASEIVRIYSTSGTTGTPSYIPLTAGDLDNWVTGSARSYAASGVAPGSASSPPTTPARSSRALRSTRSTASASLTSRSAPATPTGSSRRSSCCGPRSRSSRRRYAAYLVERVDLAASSVERVLVAGEPGGGEPAFRAMLEQGWGARVTEAMGIGDIGVSLWGECEQQDGMHLGARGFVHAELIDPDTGEPLRARRRRERRARAHPPAPPRRAAPALPHPRPRGSCGRAPARAAAPPRGSAASAAPTTC